MESSQQVSQPVKRSRVIELMAAGFVLFAVALGAVIAVAYTADGMKPRAIRNALEFAISGEATLGQELDEAGYQLSKAVDGALR